MSVATEAEYLTIEQVAELLQVDEGRVNEWIRTGRLPSCRSADDQVRLKRSDVGQVTVPVDHHISAVEAAAHEELRRQLAVPLHPAQRRAALLAIDAARRTAKEISARHGGRPFSPTSTELIREMRDERSRQKS